MCWPADQLWRPKLWRILRVFTAVRESSGFFTGADLAGVGPFNGSFPSPSSLVWSPFSLCLRLILGVYHRKWINGLLATFFYTTSHLLKGSLTWTRFITFFIHLLSTLVGSTDDSMALKHPKHKLNLPEILPSSRHLSISVMQTLTFYTITVFSSIICHHLGYPLHHPATQARPYTIMRPYILTHSFDHVLL